MSWWVDEFLNSFSFLEKCVLVLNAVRFGAKRKVKWC